MKTLKEKDKQSFLARKEEVYSLIMERDVELSEVAGAVKNQHHKKKI